MLQTHHRQAPQSSSSTMPNSAMNMGANSGGNSKYATGMAGVSASASQFKRGLPLSLMTGGPPGSMSAGPKQPGQGPSAMNQGYYPSQSAMKSGGGGNSSMTTLPSGVSVQVSNLGGGAPTTVQVGQQGALGVSTGTGGSLSQSAGNAHGLHISAGRRLSTAHMQQQHQHLHPMGGRPLKIHSAASSGPGNSIQGVMVSTASAPGVNVYNNISTAPTSVTTMGSGNGQSDS